MREIPSQKPYKNCIFAFSELVILSISVVATALVTGNAVRVWQLRFNYLYFYELSALCPPLNDNNNKSDIDIRTLLTRKGWRILKSYLHLRFVRQLLNHPAYRKCQAFNEVQHSLKKAVTFIRCLKISCVR